jgi:Mannosyltransferase (PIG-V)
MSATTPEVAYLRTRVFDWLRRWAAACPVPLRAFVVSRLIVVGAGVAGALAAPRRAGWATFDPSRISASLGAVGNVLAAPAVRWDSIHYLAIAEHGYAQAGDTVFFPLYPLLVRALGYTIGSDPLAGIVTSALSFAVALTLLHRLTKLELGPQAADVAVWLLALAPLSFFFTAVYTESLFLALSVGAVYAARRDRWALAAALGGLAAVTRVPGVLLVIPLAVIYLEAHRLPGRRLASILVLPAALGCYLGYLAARGFGPLAPIVQQTGGQHNHNLTGPITTVFAAVRTAAAGVRWLDLVHIYRPTLDGPFSPGTESIVLLGALAIAVSALVATVRRLPLAYGAYAVAALLVCTWSPVDGQPLKSVDRYTLTIFPLWMVAGAWIAERRLTRATLLMSAALLGFWSFQFATWAWVA